MFLLFLIQFRLFRWFKTPLVILTLKLPDAVITQYNHQMGPNFHRFVISSCICWDTPSENTGLWQLPKVSCAYIVKAYIIMAVKIEQKKSYLWSVRSQSARRMLPRPFLRNIWTASSCTFPNLNDPWVTYHYNNVIAYWWHHCGN